MIEWIASSALVILLVVLLRRLLKNRISLRLQYALWLLVLVRLLVPGTVGESAVSIQGPVEDVQSQIADIDLPGNWAVITVQPDLAGDGKENGAGGGVAVSPNPPDGGTPGPATVGLLLPAVGVVLKQIWWMGVVLTALLLVASNASFYRKLRRNRRRLNINESINVYVTDEIQSPCLFGAVRPAIYVPESVAGDAASLRHVLAHELTHRRHGDHIWAVLRGLCLVLHWYDPLVWWAAALSRRDCELACDEAVIRALGESDRAAYGRTLVGLAEKHSSLMRCATSMSGSDLKERIAALVKHPRTKKTAAVVLVLAVVIVGLVAFTGRADTYQARVVSTGEDYIWLAPITEGDEKKAGCEVVSSQRMPERSVAVGDLVEVTRGNSNVLTSYPPIPDIKKVELVSGAAAQDWLLCDAFFRCISHENWSLGAGALYQGRAEITGDEACVIFTGESMDLEVMYTRTGETWSYKEGPWAVMTSIRTLTDAFLDLAEGQGATIQMRTAPDGPNYAAYTVDAQWLRDHIIADFGYYFGEVETCSVQDSHWTVTDGLYLQLEVPGFLIQIGADNGVRFVRGDEVTIWTAQYRYGEDVFYDSLLTVCRDGYDQMTEERLEEQAVSAPAEGDEMALKTLWQNWLAQMFHNQVPGSRYEVEGYQVGTVEVTERAAGEDGSVRAAFDVEILVKPADYKNTAWWIGNGGGAEEVYGQAYTGWILKTYRGWLLRDGESGLWRIADFGTGGYTLDSLLQRYPL